MNTRLEQISNAEADRGTNRPGANGSAYASSNEEANNPIVPTQTTTAFFNELLREDNPGDHDGFVEQYGDWTGLALVNPENEQFYATLIEQIGEKPVSLRVAIPNGRGREDDDLYDISTSNVDGEQTTRITRSEYSPELGYMVPVDTIALKAEEAPLGFNRTPDGQTELTIGGVELSQVAFPSDATNTRSVSASTVPEIIDGLGLLDDPGTVEDGIEITQQIIEGANTQVVTLRDNDGREVNILNPETNPTVAQILTRDENNEARTLYLVQNQVTETGEPRIVALKFQAPSGGGDTVLIGLREFGDASLSVSFNKQNQATISINGKDLQDTDFAE